MRYLFWLLLLFAAAVVVTIGAHSPAYVMFVYPPYRVDMSLTLFICMMLLAMFVGYGVSAS